MKRLNVYCATGFFFFVCVCQIIATYREPSFIFFLFLLLRTYCCSYIQWVTYDTKNEQN